MLETKDSLNLMKLLDKYGEDHVNDGIGMLRGTYIPSPAPVAEDGEAPLTPDQISGVDLTRPSDLNIPPEFKSPDSDLSKYIARPPESITDQVVNPETSQFDPAKGTPAAAPSATPDMPLAASAPASPALPTAAPAVTPSLAPKLPTTSPSDIQASSYKEPTMDDFNKQLENARGEDSKRNLLFGLLKAAQMGGASLSGSKSDTSYADSQLEKGNESVNKLKTDTEMKQEKRKMLDEDKLRDPKSPASIQARDVAKSIGLKISDNTSAQDLIKSGFNLSTLFGQKQVLDERRENNRQKSLDRQAMFQSKKEAMFDKADEKDKVQLVKAQKEMDEQRATRGTPLGREVMRYNGGLHAKAIIDQYRGHENDMPNLVKKELAVAMATMVSPGLPHEKTIEGMDLKTFEGDVGDIVAKLTGTPMPGKAGGFVKFADKMIGTQMGKSQELIRDGQDKQLAVYKNSLSPKSYKLLHSLYQDKEDITTPPPGSDASQLTTKKVIPLKQKLPPGSVITNKAGKQAKVNADGMSATEL